MGFWAWLTGRSRKKAPEPASMPAAPTEADILASLARVEAMLADGTAPAVVRSRVVRVDRTIRETLPKLSQLGWGSADAYAVVATATDYLPEAVGGYLRLPRQFADNRPVDRGKSSLMILIDQLDLLGATMDKVFDAVCRADAEALVVHGRFLEEKFGAAAGGGDLIIGSTAVPPMPTTDPSGPSPLTPPPGRTA